MYCKPKHIAALLALAISAGAFAANTGGFATTDGNIGKARKFEAKTHTEIQKIIEDARTDSAGKKVATGAYPVHIVYTGNEDALIAKIVKGHTKGSDGSCPEPHWNDAYRFVEIKNFTAGVTIEGKDGSSANFGVVINGGSSNVVVRNMKIGALGGAAKDADMFRIDGASNVWIDHNEMFAVNNECKGSPEGDLTFESAIDIKKEAHNITVSYNYIHDVKKVGLDGSSSTDIAGGRKITYHHNYYKNVNARLPLQRGGWIHVYNNLYDGITESGINVRQKGYALIERNWFQNAKNPVTCRSDSSNCGWWDLRNNNILSTADFKTYNITWGSVGSGEKNADDWKTTAAFPITLPYTYEPVSAQCVKDKLASFAGVGKNGAQLTAAACSGSAASSSSSAKSSSSSSAAASSQSSSAASSAASSSQSSSAASSSAPALAGTSDNPTGFAKCADEGATCSVSKGTGWVAFGRKGKWVSKYVGVGKSVACTVAAFGSDPKGNPNKCSYQQ